MSWWEAEIPQEEKGWIAEEEHKRSKELDELCSQNPPNQAFIQQ